MRGLSDLANDMTNSVRQMQMQYDPEEDRILFRINSGDRQEFRFWLTRRYAALLLRVLGEHVAADPDVSTQVDPTARAAVTQFKQEQARSQADFGKPFDEAPAEFPLGADALLAHKVTGGRRGDDLILGIHPKSGQGINMTLSQSLNLNLTHMLTDAVRRAQWGINVGNVPQADGPGAEGGAPVIHG